MAMISPLRSIIDNQSRPNSVENYTQNKSNLTLMDNRLDVDLSTLNQSELSKLENVLNRNDALLEVEAQRLRRLSVIDEASPGQSQSRTAGVISAAKREQLSMMLLQKEKQSEVRCRYCDIQPYNDSVAVADTSRSKMCLNCRNLLLRAKSGAWFRSEVQRRWRHRWEMHQMEQNMQQNQIPGAPRHSSMTMTDNCRSLLQSQQSVPQTERSSFSHTHILHRLRSFNSLQSELDEIDHMTQSDNKQVSKCLTAAGSVRSPSRHYRMVDDTEQCSINLAEVLHDRLDTLDRLVDSADSEQQQQEKDNKSEDNHSVLDCDIVNHQLQRRITHVPHQPLKSSCNGSPLCLDEQQQQHSGSQRRFSQNNDNNNTCTSLSGEVLLETDYNFRTGQFIVILRQCRALPCVDSVTNTISPYLFTLLLPDRSKKSRRTTTVKRNTCSPTYDQIFKYTISPTELETRSLLVMLCHKDDTGYGTRDVAVGQLVIPLAFTDFFNRPSNHSLWYPFQPVLQPQHLQKSNDFRSSTANSISGTNSSPSAVLTSNTGGGPNSAIPPYYGEISLAIKFMPRSTSPNGELHVWVKSMRNVLPCSYVWSSPTSEEPIPTNVRRMSCCANGKSVATSPTGGKVTGPYTVAAAGILQTAGNGLLNAMASVTQGMPIVKVCLLPYRNSVQTTPPARQLQPQSLPNQQQQQQQQQQTVIWSTILKFPRVSIQELRTRGLEVSVWAHCRQAWLDRLIQPRCLGGVRLYLATDLATTPEERMWIALLDRPGVWIDATLRLKMDSSFLNVALVDG